MRSAVHVFAKGGDLSLNAKAHGAIGPSCRVDRDATCKLCHIRTETSRRLGQPRTLPRHRPMLATAPLYPVSVRSFCRRLGTSPSFIALNQGFDAKLRCLGIDLPVLFLPAEAVIETRFIGGLTVAVRNLALIMAVFGTCCQHVFAIDLDFRRSEKVAVYDAETELPIAGANIVTHPIGIFLLGMPKDGKAISGKNGRTSIRMPTLNPMWRVSADGYQTDGGYRSEKGEKTFHLYKGPRPKINIVVSDGYRGPLKVEMRLVSDRIQNEIGKREFTFRATPDGFVAFKATPLLLMTQDDPTMNRQGDEIHAVYQNGLHVPDNYRHKVSDIGLRWVSHAYGEKKLRILYVIGNDKDKEVMDHTITHREPDRYGGVHITSNWEAFNALFDQHANVEQSLAK